MEAWAKWGNQSRDRGLKIKERGQELIVKPTHCFRWASLVLSAALVLLATARIQAKVQILTSPGASPLESFAAREAARYFYLRTGNLPAITEKDKAAAGAIIIARKDRPAIISAPEINAAAKDLQPQQYILKTLTTEDGKTFWIVGGDDVGTLYGAYRFAEKLGVRFYLHGDVIPDMRIKADLPTLDEVGKPDLRDSRHPASSLRRRI